MCNTKMQQFLSGFLVGVVMCFWVISFFEQWQVVKYSTSLSGKYDDTKKAVGYSVIARLIGRLMKSNDDVPGTVRHDSKYPGIPMALENKTVVTCIVPLPGGILEFSQPESGVLLKWTDSCDHVVFISPRQKRYLQKSITELKLRRNNNFHYFSRDLSEFYQSYGIIRSQFKALQFAKITYPDTGLFIITPSSSEVVKDVVKGFTENMEDNFRFLTSLNELLTTNNTHNNYIILSVDKFLILGKNAVSSLIKQVTSDKCHFDDSQPFREWTANCINTLDIM